MQSPNDRPRDRDDVTDLSEEIDIDDGTFRQSFLKGMAELAEESGDWRTHLPYNVLAMYRKNSAVRERFRVHYESCAYCQELMDTLFPADRS